MRIKDEEKGRKSRRATLITRFEKTRVYKTRSDIPVPFPSFPFPNVDSSPLNPSNTLRNALFVAKGDERARLVYVTPVYVTGEPWSGGDTVGRGRERGAASENGGELGEGRSARRVAWWGQRCLRAVARSDDVQAAWWG